MTLYQRLRRKFSASDPAKAPPLAQESLVYNPVGIKVGGVVKVDILDLRDHRFTCKEIRESTISVGGVIFQIVDYALLSRPLDGEELQVRLRMGPDPDPTNDVGHGAMVLRLSDSLAYDEGLHDVVQDDVNENFRITTDGVEDEFWRVGDVGTSYMASVRSLVDGNGNGAVDADEVTSSQVEFWDYSRMTEIEGVETEEYLFVEMDKTTGWFEIWRGADVNPERIEVF